MRILLIHLLVFLLSTSTFSKVFPSLKYNDIITNIFDISAKGNYKIAQEKLDSLRQSTTYNPELELSHIILVSSYIAEYSDTSLISPTLKIASKLQLDSSKYFSGMANIFEGILKGYRGGFLPSLFPIRDGIDHFKKYEIIYGSNLECGGFIGSYLYWGSRIFEGYYWLPFINDDRYIGITRLEESLKSNKIFLPYFANSLLWIYFDEKQYNKALKVAELILKEYPNNISFNIAKGDILFEMGNIYSAIDIQEKMNLNIKNIESVPLKEFYTYGKLAIIYFKKRDTVKTRFYLDKYDSIKKVGMLKKRLNNIQEPLKNVRKGLQN